MDRRKQKRVWRKRGIFGPVFQAYEEGAALSQFGSRDMPPRLHKNPYPAGRRHDAWERGREYSRFPDAAMHALGYV